MISCDDKTSKLSLQNKYKKSCLEIEMGVHFSIYVHQLTARSFYNKLKVISKLKETTKIYY